MAGGARHLRCQLRPADGNPSPYLNTNVHTDRDADGDADAGSHRDADVDAQADAHRDADGDAHSLLGHAGLYA